jgi:multidrug resistance protein, MATE family
VSSARLSLRQTATELLRLALPLSFIQVGASSLGFIDAAVVGRVSATDLAAVGLGGALVFVVSFVAMGLVMGSEPLMAQAIGAGDHVRARQWLRQALWVAVVLSIPATVLSAALGWVLPWFDVDPNVIPAARSYMGWRACGTAPFLLYWACKSYLQAIGRTTAPVVGVAIAVVVELVLDVVLVFGVESMAIPALGADGAGIAHVVTNWVRFGIVLWSVLSTSTLPGRWSRLVAAWQAPALWQILRVGTPLALQLGAEVALFTLAGLVIGTLGVVPLAAHQVALQCASATFSVVVGLGSAASVVVGRAIGAGDEHGARQAGIVSVAMAIAFMTFTALMFFFFGAPLASLLSTDAEVIAGAASLLAIAAAFQLSDGVQGVASGALRGAADTHATFLIHLAAHWGIGVPCLVILVAVGAGATGVWWALTAALSVAAVALVWRFLHLAKRGFARV